MLSLQGVYKDGKIVLLHKIPHQLPEESEVLLTFIVDSEFSTAAVAENEDSLESSELKEADEDYYKSIREFERVKASGNITIINPEGRFKFPLNDYSQGGLSFITDQPFKVGQNISSGIADPSNPNMVLMELEMEVRGVHELERSEFTENDENRYRIGCMFVDSVDEDLWHGLLQYLQ